MAGQNTVREHARNLVNDLTALRRDAVGRPIIFVAHSLGGLVCQDALLICINPSEEAQSDILSSTCGIAFLGTPHAGSDLEKFATAVANVASLVKKPNKKLLQVLRSNSEILANIKNDFLTMVRMRDRLGSLKPIELHAFVEELPVDVIGRVSLCCFFPTNRLTYISAWLNPIQQKYQPIIPILFMLIIWK